MLIMPLEKSIDWAKPPWVTFFLMLSCGFVYFFFQNNDDAFKHSIEYYFSSELPKLELLAYAKTQDDDSVIDDLEEILAIKFEELHHQKQESLVYFLMQMERDEAFFMKLKNKKIVTSINSRFKSWKRQRKHYEKLQKNSFNAQYSFTPIKHEAITFISHQFLHGSVGHLLGNMLFLFLIGYSVEAALGSFLYLLCYLITGIGAVTFFWLASPNSVIPLVGASGAISGVMGMYAGIFGMRKIRMFYWVLFYFNYIKAPALIMLPFWVAYEIFQLLTISGSNVAFMAHIGGFITGGVTALILSYVFKNNLDLEYINASTNQESKTQRYQQASNLLGDLKIPGAIRLLTELHVEYPEDREILFQLFKASSYKPDSSEFHKLISEIISLNDNDPKSLKMVNAAFQHYLKAENGAIKLSANSLFTLIIRFAKAGYVKDAEYIVQMFLRKKPDTPDLDIALLAVANSWRQQHQQERYDNCIALLRKHFPGKVV